jgi:hypothetical protein
MTRWSAPQTPHTPTSRTLAAHTSAPQTARTLAPHKVSL